VRAGWKSCPRCTELEKQLQYWRKKAWYQRARDARKDKLKADREEISVNVNSRFTGMVVANDAPPQGVTRLYAPARFVQFSTWLTDPYF
jgi:hypothetical protein